MSHEAEILARQSNVSSVSLPAPRVPIAIRVATLDDLAFVDALQKKHHKQLGFFPRAQMEGYLRNGWVLIAEDSSTGSTSSPQAGSGLGYIAFHDRYQKRDELGAIFQLCVDDSAQRKLVGAMLVREAFERSPYGCKLYCCWCAQDLAANHFWEALGFVPLAFRAGSAKKQRVHIFWCKRIRQGETTTPWWFPSQTTGGSMMEDRLVLPIPPGTHWSDAKPIVLPRDTQPRQLEDAGAMQPAAKKIKPALKIVRKRAPLSGGLKFQLPERLATKDEQPKRQKKTKIKNDPKFVSAARELRDRWLEKVNSGEYLPGSRGKYEVARELPASESKPIPLLAA